MDALGVLRPDQTPHATAYVDQMVDLVADLVDRGVAYETADRGLPVGARRPRLRPAGPPAPRVAAGRRPDRGRRGEAVAARLRAVEEGQAGRADAGTSPWGAGRPGWHTECVVMSLDLLGEGFDLHGGGQDLIFPHHENERAQAVADGQEFARHWVHNGWVTVEGEKMSKSLGNFTSLDDLLARSDARAYRLLVLRSHYRSPIEVTPDTIAQAEAGLARLDELARRFGLARPAGRRAGDVAAATRRRRRRRRGGGGVPAVAWTTTSTPPGRWPASSTWPAGPTPPPTPATPLGAAGGAAPRRPLAAALGLPLAGRAGDDVDAATAALVRRRDEARAARDWARPTRSGPSSRRPAGWSRTGPRGPASVGVGRGPGGTHVPDTTRGRCRERRVNTPDSGRSTGAGHVDC